MNFDLSPTCLAVFCQMIDQIRVVLFAGEKVSMTENPSIRVRPIPHDLWIFLAPALQPLLLLGVRSMSGWRLWNDRRLKVVGHTNDEVDGAGIRAAASDSLPGICRQPDQSVSHFLPNNRV